MTKYLFFDIFPVLLISYFFCMRTQQKFQLLEGRYKYLYLWKSLEDVMKENDLSSLISSKNFPDVIQETFHAIYVHPEKKNIFWYLTEISAFRGVVGIMKELLDTDPLFAWFCQQLFQKYFFSFDQLIKFTRNVFMHAVDTTITVKIEDYEKQRSYLLSQGVSCIDFVWNHPSVGRFHIKIHLAKLLSGQSFWNIVSAEQMEKLATICYITSKMYTASLHKK